MVFALRSPRLSLFLLHWHFAQIIVAGFNWRFFISMEESMLGSTLIRFYLSFVVIGLFSYLFLASLFIYWPYRYGCYMLPKNRRNKLMIGTAVIYLFHVLPLWMMEFSIVWTYGWITVLQGVSFMFLTISWILETLGVWYGYAWHMAGFMNKNYGHTKFGRGGM